MLIASMLGCSGKVASPAASSKSPDKNTLFVQMDNHMTQGDYRAALNDIELLITHHGKSASMLAYKAVCESKLDPAVAARTAFDCLKLSHSEKSNPSRNAAEIFSKKWISDPAVYRTYSNIFDKAAWVMAGKMESTEAGAQIAYLEMAIVEGNKFTTQAARDKVAAVINPIRDLNVTFDY